MDFKRSVELSVFGMVGFLGFVGVVLQRIRFYPHFQRCGKGDEGPRNPFGAKQTGVSLHFFTQKH